MKFDDESEGQTPLALVAANRTSLVRTLQVFLDVGVDVNARGNRGETPIYLVLDGGDFDPVAAGKVQLLLRYGARLDVYSDRGYCAFDRALAISRSTGDASVVDFIFQHGTTANFGDGYLDRVVAHSYAFHLFNECRLLTGHGAALKLSDERLYTNIRNGIDRKDLKQINFHLDLFPDRIKPFEILEMALRHYKDAKEDDMEIIKSLLARPGLGSTETCLASRLLSVACKHHLKVAVARLLLDKGGQVNEFDSGWETPLSYAVDIECRPMVRYLLLHGADPHMAPSDEDWSSHVSKSTPGHYMEHLAFGDNRYLTPFMRAISLYRHEDTHESCDTDASGKLAHPLEFMLQHKPLPPISQDPESLSYIHYALAWPDSLRILLARGADPNSSGHCTRPPLLHFLAIADKLRPAKPEALSILLEFGADIHRTDAEGRSFLTMMRRCTLAMANNPLFDAELEHEKLGFAAGLLVRNFFITLDAKTGEDYVQPRPKEVADANYSEYLDRLAAYSDRQRQLASWAPGDMNRRWSEVGWAGR
ncbi:putative nacht and ankyrin domain protein [Diaporthe ampelina]|uniref:Putative nacht and ankyrin domain protein n=1 Tax=Diaporthe ampelina TaxID=1214573 RepID=A0A0G2F4Q1_9PEZI|nr:putative nacht and ankyrin domain protein [Diaporthe ampelina]